MSALVAAALLALLVVGCEESAPESGGATVTDASPPPDVSPPPDASTERPPDQTAFILSSFGFLYPDDLTDPVGAFDLDDRASRADMAAIGECAHDDFAGGLDYSFLHLIERFEGLQAGQIVDGVMSGAVKNGSMTIAFELEGLDDPRDDEDVSITFHSSEEAPPTGANGEVLPDGTVSAHSDERYRGTAVSGVLADGELIAGPVDIAFDFNIQIVRAALTIRRAFVRVAIDGERVSGTIAGFWDIADVRTILGEPTTMNNNAAGFTIDELVGALDEHADGGFDAGLEDCTSISTVFRFEGVRGFITR